jgi:hypothetical protein
MAQPIVQVNVSIQEAPSPDSLQKSYALLSQGGTSTAPGTITLLTQPSSLTPFVTITKALSTLTQAAGLATATATAAHGFTVGDTVPLTIAGATPVAYNGTFVCTITTTTAFTFAIASGTTTPATGTITYIAAETAELKAMTSTWFGQNANTPVYVLELGPGNVNDGVAFLSAWIIANPNGIAYGNGFWGFYGYVVPRHWDANTNFLALAATFQAPTLKTYFWVTTTLSTYSVYTPLYKCIEPLIESPVLDVFPANALTAISYTGGVVTATTTTAHGVSPGAWFQISGCLPIGYNGWWQAQAGTTGSTLVYNSTVADGSETTLGTLVGNLYANAGISTTEFSIAAAANRAASFDQSTMVPPFQNGFLFGVTPFPTMGMSALLTTLADANISVVGTAAQGGLSTATLQSGLTADGNTFNWWYAIDAANVNTNLAITNAVINGSNTNVAPLYDNQQGINTLQAVAASALSALISCGCIFGTLLQTELPAATFAANSNAGLYDGYCVINAVPFSNYYALNPGDYKIGRYAGFAVSMAPQQGFQNIVFNIQATQFVG